MNQLFLVLWCVWVGEQFDYEQFVQKELLNLFKNNFTATPFGNFKIIIIILSDILRKKIYKEKFCLDFCISYFVNSQNLVMDFFIYKY